MAKRAFIDADMPLYSVAFSVEEAVDWGDDLWTLHADLGQARDLFDLWVDTVKTDLKVKEVVLCLSDKQNWRKDLYPEYKANRSRNRKPVVFRPLRDWIITRYKAKVVPDLEADDLLGINANKSTNILVSGDKDLRTVPGLHYNPDRADKGVVRIIEDEGRYNHMMQTLTGDAVDNFKGCPGVGPKAAQKVLADLSPDEYWPAVVARYEKAGLTEEDALLQARLAFILTKPYYKRKEVILWTP